MFLFPKLEADPGTAFGQSGVFYSIWYAWMKRVGMYAADIYVVVCYRLSSRLYYLSAWVTNLILKCPLGLSFGWQDSCGSDARLLYSYDSHVS